MEIPRKKTQKKAAKIWSWKLHNGRALVYLSRADEFERTAILIFILRHWKFHEWREISLNSFEGPGSPGRTTTPNNNLKYRPTAHLIFFLSSPCIDSKINNGDTSQTNFGFFSFSPVGDNFDSIFCFYYEISSSNNFTTLRVCLFKPNQTCC